MLIKKLAQLEAVTGGAHLASVFISPGGGHAAVEAAVQSKTMPQIRCLLGLAQWRILQPTSVQVVARHQQGSCFPGQILAVLRVLL